MSVWTHLSEEDVLFYFKEIGRVLKSGGKAIVTFFILDEQYENSVHERSSERGRYHMTSQDKWVFDQHSYGSDAWFHPRWAKVPESAIGVTSIGLDRLITVSGLRIVKHLQGNWKESPGVFFKTS